ncbi:MAG TPA: PEGA domain-containing protein, partial [Gaiellaceae bacterium]|nr:PEGA domain-containing protein [Gaiellaceae bacterium]
GEGVPVHAIPPQQPDLATPRGRSTGAILAVLAIAGVVVLSGVVAIASRRGAEAPGAASAAAPPAVAASAPPGAPPSAVATAAEVAEEPPQIDFTIKASPPGARISIDGVPAGANPAVGKRPRDGAMHLIRVEAPGHDPREESIAFDRSVLVTIELRASAPAAEAPTPAPANTPKPAPPRPTRAPRPQTPGGKLDSENPYQ